MASSDASGGGGAATPAGSSSNGTNSTEPYYVLRRVALGGPRGANEVPKLIALDTTSLPLTIGKWHGRQRTIPSTAPQAASMMIPYISPLISDSAGRTAGTNTSKVTLSTISRVSGIA